MSHRGDWKDHERDIIRRDWGTARLTSDIARELGRSADAVRMQAMKLGLKRPIVKPRGNGKWDNEEGMAMLARMEHLLVVKRHTVSEVSQILSTEAGRPITRNTIIGLSDRRGFTRAKTTDKPSIPGLRKATAIAEPKNRSNGGHARRAREKAIMQAKAQKPVAPTENTHREPTAYRPEAWEPIVGSFPKPLMKLTASCCKWPVGGSGAETLFCCEAVRAELEPYCAHHAQRGYADTGSAKDLARGLRKFV